ncbi:antibiotic biosynthesis monooxygenase [Piscinibacter sp. XHJ-5]|uniref:putative quinol monooxygenase n=1 Tax=Piscinibacter sp. XHJ-5 TaxID=3037797 RepID=UPI002452B805|nr:antibiotic biosynthesis monooxygenase [Piscinibacter sp. XHJ-5]
MALAPARSQSANGTPGRNTEIVSFVVYIPIKRSAKVHGRKMLLDVIAAMSSEPDFVNTWVHQQMDDEDTIVVYETWACSREHFLAHHLKKPYRQAYEAALPDLLSAERRIIFLEQIAAYPQRRG